MAFYIITDIGSDLPLSYVEKQKNFIVMPLFYRMEGVERPYGAGDEKNISQFYQKLNDGAQATTTQINVTTYYNQFKQLTDRGEEVLYISLSGGISGSFQSAQMAQKMILEETPGAKLEVVDGMSASMGQGLLVHYVLQNRDAGMSLREAAEWVVNNRQHIIHWFTVSDLNFLFRGGRVSRTSAFVGTMLRIKPILHVNFEGRLIPKEKVQGRKHSIKALAKKVVENASPKEGQTIFISHGDCEEEAKYLAEMIREGLPNIRELLISPIGCVIGAHSGPGTLAVFFRGEAR